MSVEITDWTEINEPVSFYKSVTNANSAGFATFCLDSKGNRIGYYDLWDFDWNNWGKRPKNREILVRAASIRPGTPYNVQYKGCTQIK